MSSVTFYLDSELSEPADDPTAYVFGSRRFKCGSRVVIKNRGGSVAQLDTGQLAFFKGRPWDDVGVWDNSQKWVN